MGKRNSESQKLKASAQPMAIPDFTDEESSPEGLSFLKLLN